MFLKFADRTNQDIDILVRLCQETGEITGSVLMTPPMEDLLDPSSVARDEDYAEAEEDGWTITPEINAFPFDGYTSVFPEPQLQDLIIAVDSGVESLGSLTGGGVAFAIRGAAVVLGWPSPLVLRYNTGAILITPANKGRVFRYIGERLGSPDMYVEDLGGVLVPKPAMVDTPNQIEDRCRNFVERLIQEECLGILAANNGGLLLIDGALAESYDTPAQYLADLLGFAKRRAIDICAISKKSRIVIGSVPIDSLFDSYPTFVGYAPLLDALRQERRAYETLKLRPAANLTAGNEIYAVRFGFSPPGITFRVDTAPSLGSTNEEVVNAVYQKCPIVGGYPKLLVDAHQYSSFLGADSVSLLSDLVVKTGLRPKERPSMNVIFQPFGAFGK